MGTRNRFIVVIAFLVLVLGGLFGWRIYQITQLQAQFSQPQPPTPVAATEAVVVSWVPAVSSVGSLRAINGVQIANEVPGVVEKILFESGQWVEQGQTLVELDAATDEAALTTLRADAQLANSEFERVADLIRKNAVSQAVFDAAQANMEAATARVNQQEAQLAKKTLRAPFDGVLGLRLVDLGEYLPAGSSAVEINMLDPIYVEYTIAEKELGHMAVGDQVELFIAATPDERFTGTVSAINSSVNPETRTVNVRATIPNSENRLKPGMFASVRTLRRKARELVAVPRTAISYNTYGNFVFALVENDQGGLVTERRSVTTGETNNGMVEIVEGLQPGEAVVKTGLLRLRADQPVQIQSEQEQEQEQDQAAQSGENGDEGAR
jgi:membrane fusion protein (multidrug efflux system)